MRVQLSAVELLHHRARADGRLACGANGCVGALVGEVLGDAVVGDVVGTGVVGLPVVGALVVGALVVGAFVFGAVGLEVNPRLMKAPQGFGAGCGYHFCMLD